MKKNSARVRAGARRGGPLAAAALAAMLTGCAAPNAPLYHWGAYQNQLYEHFKADRSSPNEQLLALQSQAEKARASHQALPPGFRAHMGMLYLQLGRGDEARQNLEAEKLAFPEAAPYMDFLLKRMNAGTASRS